MNHRRQTRMRLLLAGAAALGLHEAALAGASEATINAPVDTLAAEFLSPPNSARPRVWWHWMNGNITKDGIRKDLEWMKRVGVGGLQNFDAALATPQVVPERLSYMTPGWKDAFKYAVTLSDQLGLEMAIAASPGWSETGGPWVPSEDGIKKLVWSETTVEGGRRFNGPLAAPPSTIGPFADMGRAGGIASEAKPIAPRYADVAVLAVPMNAPVAASPRASSMGKPIDAAPLSDGLYARSLDVERPAPNEPAELELTYDAPQTIRSATIAFKPMGISLFAPTEVLPVLDVQRDDGVWVQVAEVPIYADVPSTVSFAPVTGNKFRFRFLKIKTLSTAERVGAAPGALTNAYRPPNLSTTVSVAEARLSSEARVDKFEAKAGYSVARDYYELEQSAPADAPGVAPAKVIDLTHRLSADGRLDWTPPAGRWKVIRLGWSLTGTLNHPATAEATGLEVDKLDRAAVERYMTTYIDMFRQTVGPELIGKKGLQAIVTDSIEVGAFNWTPQLPDHFRRLRGYDLTPWLPALTGVIIGSRAETDRFLFDFRRTIADLVTSEHYGAVADVARKNDLLVYGEALEAGRPSLGDDMSMRSHADIPMAAMWTYPTGNAPRPVFRADMKGAASVANLYGQKIVAAESLTSGFNFWSHSPSDLKPMIDYEFASGINRPVIHTSVHQPVDDKQPGLSLLIFGQYFNRHDTWAEMARPWVDYMARSSFMLQQGRNVADVAYFYGEEAPLTGLYRFDPPTDTPTRYAYDFLSADALHDKIKVQDGEAIADGGARYKVIYLGGSSQKMTVKTLARLEALAKAGATIVGEAPTASPALADDPEAFTRLVNSLWSGGAQTKVGAGRVIASKNVEASLQSIGVAPDLMVSDSGQVLFVHRKMDGGDTYFLTNRENAPRKVEARFRIKGMEPELWRAETGQAEAVSYRLDGDHVVVSLDMAPNDAVFVVFRRPAPSASVTVAKATYAPIMTVDQAWKVQFQPGRGAPQQIETKTLQSLSLSSDPGVRYFSGIATYSTQFTAPRSLDAKAPLLLDLGSVKDVAEVVVNGRSLGYVWKAPYQIDVAKAVKPGTNTLEVRVANLWVNRLIGDAQPGANKIAFTTTATYAPDTPLRESGLIGPVRLLAAKASKP